MLLIGGVIGQGIDARLTYADFESICWFLLILKVSAGFYDFDGILNNDRGRVGKSPPLVFS